MAPDAAALPAGDRSNSLLSVRDVVKSYGSVKALDKVTLSVQPGEFVALLGANGAGKSTLLQLLTGLFTPDEGQILVLGNDMRISAVEALAGIGVVFQQQTLDLELSVRANLLFHSDLHGIPRREANERIAAALALYGLNERAKDRTRQLSGGNRRRVELARALLHRPRILLMDEATVGLDPVSRRELLQEMVRLKTVENLGILWTTHLFDEIEQADRFIVLRRGHVVFEGTRDELLQTTPGEDVGTIVIGMMGPGETDGAGPPTLS